MIPEAELRTGSPKRVEVLVWLAEAPGVVPDSAAATKGQRELRVEVRVIGSHGDGPDRTVDSGGGLVSLE
jgi:hypothetical protein